MRHHFAQPAREEVPPVTRPYPFGMEAFDQLSDDCFNAPSLLDQKERPMRLFPLGRAIWCKQAQALPGKLFAHDWTPIVAITQSPTFSSLQQPLGHRQLMHISWRQVQAHDHTRPADSQMCAHAEESLMSKLVIAIGRHLAQSAATCGSCKAADRHRETVNQRNGPVNFQVARQVLPETLFNPPQVRCLTSKGRAMNTAQGREEMVEVAAKIGEDRFILIQSEIFTDRLHRQHFRARQQRQRPALAHRLAVKRSGERIVYKAEDCYNKSVQVHDEPPVGERQTLTSEGLVAWTFNFQRTKT